MQKCSFAFKKNGKNFVDKNFLIDKICKLSTMMMCLVEVGLRAVDYTTNTIVCSGQRFNRVYRYIGEN